MPNTEEEAEEFKANAYSIERKSNLIVQLLTFGIEDYAFIKVS